ncbi:TetR/AcrR family transcriptional regulator [Geodermatophilus sp. DSM 44513]|uniref:TetR/AcrR family transcriptional regulator n=1 Tax=Geodermatophilus sp. DSM 44513 TaxID=1528104 RepID=UPI00141275B9|nr:TetR/AcrR family transcriptional regulator [Geodermatophilus sp. DSM 44513]WNV77585.1 TetR/AcrR family transcriptional regulator [Geodermatophilus sp. DSM 44513]
MTPGARAVGRTDPDDDVAGEPHEAVLRQLPTPDPPAGPALPDDGVPEAGSAGGGLPAGSVPGSSAGDGGAPPLPGTTSPAAPPAAAETDPRSRRGRRALRGPGLRERRRQQTRAAIIEAAAELFAERGFDAVSVVEIAQRAGVVEKTVFNHFPVKEGLVFEADPPVRAALLETVRTRPAGESVTAAAGTFVVRAMSGLGAPEAAAGVAEMAGVIRGSRTLQVREREILGELTTALAALVAEETGAEPGDLAPWLAAQAVLGLYAALLELARDRVLAGVSGPALSAELLARGERGLALLQFGLAGYAKRR